MPEMINIRGFNMGTHPSNKTMSDKLHECLNCKGCISEKTCKELDAKSKEKKEGERK